MTDNSFEDEAPRECERLPLWSGKGIVTYAWVDEDILPKVAERNGQEIRWYIHRFPAGPMARSRIELTSGKKYQIYLHRLIAFGSAGIDELWHLTNDEIATRITAMPVVKFNSGFTLDCRSNNLLLGVGEKPLDYFLMIKHQVEDKAKKDLDSSRPVTRVRAGELDKARKHQEVMDLDNTASRGGKSSREMLEDIFKSDEMGE